MRPWTFPVIRNINCGMEVTSYESAEVDGDFIGPDGVVLRAPAKDPKASG